MRLGLREGIEDKIWSARKIPGVQRPGKLAMLQ